MEWLDFERMNANTEGQPFEQGQYKKGLKALCGMVNSQRGRGFLALGVDDDGNTKLSGGTESICTATMGGRTFGKAKARTR